MTTPPTSGSARPVGRRARRLVAVLAALMAALALIPAAASPVAADDFGLDREGRLIDGPGSIPEDWIHDYCFDFDTTTYDGAWASYYLWTGYYNVMYSTYYTERYAGKCTADTDVVFRINNDLVETGKASCRSWVNGGSICRSNLVQINMWRIGTDAHRLIQVGCHEVGHTIGLADGTGNAWWNDCMIDGRAPAGWQFETLNQHHIDHANSRRPFDDPND